MRAWHIQTILYELQVTGDMLRCRSIQTTGKKASRRNKQEIPISSTAANLDRKYLFRDVFILSRFVCIIYSIYSIGWLPGCIVACFVAWYTRYGRIHFVVNLYMFNVVTSGTTVYILWYKQQTRQTIKLKSFQPVPDVASSSSSPQYYWIDVLCIYCSITRFILFSVALLFSLVLLLSVCFLLFYLLWHDAYITLLVFAGVTKQRVARCSWLE